jgi:hypothetical protein
MRTCLPRNIEALREWRGSYFSYVMLRGAVGSDGHLFLPSVKMFSKISEMTHNRTTASWIWNTSSRRLYGRMSPRTFVTSYCNMQHDLCRLYLLRTYECRSQWPRGIRRELSSLARALGSWVRIPLKAWVSVCVHLFCVCVVLCLCNGLAKGWSRVQGVLPSA